MDSAIRKLIETMVTRCRFRHTRFGCEQCYRNDYQNGTCEALNALKPQADGKPNPIWENGGNLKEVPND